MGSTMPPKKKKGDGDEKPWLGRPGNHVKMGIVGLPNVGKSTTFNLLCGMAVDAENYPFCTIDPTVSRVELPDKRYDWLVEKYAPKSEVPAYLSITDIAGLVKGAAEGAGLGNAFLSHINACDGIYHLVRCFDDKDIIHVDDSVDPVRDLATIRGELLAKDLELLKINHDKVVKEAKRDAKNKQKQLEMDTMNRVVELVESGVDVRFGNWNKFDVEVLNQYQLLTAKPVVYLCNLSEKGFITKKNKHLAKLSEWIKAQPEPEPCIPYSAVFETKYLEMDEAERKAFCEENNCRSAFPRIIKSGYNSLHLQHFYTCGPDEVKCWTIRQRTKAPQAAGTIHGDFEKCFIKAQIMKYSDMEELGSEAEVKAKGLMREKGKDYVMEDGDIVHFMHNAK